jgi:hypothetical protein
MTTTTTARRGENIANTRDNGNVVIGGTGEVNAQIGDTERGAVVMGREPHLHPRGRRLLTPAKRASAG